MKALAKQIIGKGKNVTFDDPEAEKEYRALRVVQEDIRGLMAALDGLGKSADTYATEGRSVLEVFENLGPKWQKEGLDEVSRVVRGSVGLLRQSQGLNLKLEQEVQANVLRPLRDLNENEFKRVKHTIKALQEARATYHDLQVSMEREKKKGKVTALDAENQVKRAAADYEVLERECRKAMRSATDAAQTATITIACAYLQAYQTFWDQGAKMREALLATTAKHLEAARERESRIRAEQNRVIRVFGLPLEDVVQRDGKVPQFVFDLMTHISAHGLEEEGIFRVPGNLDALNLWKRKIDNGVAGDLLKSISIHDAAGLLKLYLRELPAPLIPVPFYEEFMKVDVNSIKRRSVVQADVDKRGQVAAILARLPAHVFQVLKELVYMSTLIASKSSINKMDAANIARSLAPGLMRGEETTDMMAVLAASHASNDFFEHLIDHYPIYFERQLHTVASLGDVQQMRGVLALSDGVGLLQRDECGATLLHCAAENGHTEMCRLLLDSPHGQLLQVTAVDSKGETALHRALNGAHLECASLLVARGASLEALSSDGTSGTALLAMQGGSAADRFRDMVDKEKAALASGFAANPSGPSSSSKGTPLKSESSSGSLTSPRGVISPRGGGSSNASSGSSSGPPANVAGAAPAPPRPTSKPAQKSAKKEASASELAAEITPEPPLVRRNSMAYARSSGSRKDLSSAVGQGSTSPRQSSPRLDSPRDLDASGSPYGMGSPMSPKLHAPPSQSSPRSPVISPKATGSVGDKPAVAGEASSPLPPRHAESAKKSSGTSSGKKQERLSVLPERLSEADPHQVLWRLLQSETFYEITPLSDAVLAFSAIVCDPKRCSDDLAVRQSLKEIARGLQTFFRQVDALVDPFSSEDAEAVRQQGAKVKDCATGLLAVVRDQLTGAAGAEAASRGALERESQALAVVTLELFDCVERGRYRVINAGMQRTAEEAAALAKANLPSQLSRQRAGLQEASTQLAGQTVGKSLQLGSEEHIGRLLLAMTQLLGAVAEARHPEATSQQRAASAKQIILLFRGVKTAFKEADDLSYSEKRSDAEVMESLCQLMLEIRAPEDYEPESDLEKSLLDSVAAFHDVLVSKRREFGQWRKFGVHFDAIMARLSDLSSVIRRVRQGRMNDPAMVNKLSFYVNALEFHRARCTLVVAQACIADYNAQPERNAELRAAVPVLQGPTRPSTAFTGLVTLLLNAVPMLFTIIRSSPQT